MQPFSFSLAETYYVHTKYMNSTMDPHSAPYGQWLDLGWVTVGEVCLSGVHKPNGINVYRTNVLPNGRTSFLSPCAGVVNIKERFDKRTASQSTQTCKVENTDDLGSKYSKELKRMRMMDVYGWWSLPGDRGQTWTWMMQTAGWLPSHSDHQDTVFPITESKLQNISRLCVAHWKESKK